MCVLGVPPASAQQHETLQGTVQVVTADNPTTHTSTTQYSLNMGRSLLQLVFPDPSVIRGVASGSRVEVTGTRAGKQFIVDAADTDDYRGAVRVLATPPSTSRFGQWKVAVILINYADTSAQPIDTPTLGGFMDQVNQFYEEASYNQLSIAWDIYGYFTLPVNAGCGDTNFNNVTTAGIEAATQSGIDLSKYQSYVFIGPDGPNPSCDDYAFGTVGGNPGLVLIQVIPGTAAIQTGVISHELGHNLGFSEAQALECGLTTYNPGCPTAQLIDELFDVMGLGGDYLRPPHFNASIKELFGWLTAQPVNNTAVYTIAPIEKLGSAPNALKIGPLPAGDIFYIEYRQPIGFDADMLYETDPTVSAVFNGALFHVLNPSFSNPGDSYLLDMNPGTSSFWSPTNPVLWPNESYVDYANRFAATTLSASPASAQVLVLVPGMTTPTLAFVSPTNGSTVSGAVDISIDALDRSGIVKIDLSLDGSPLTGLTAAPYTYIWNTLTGPLGKHVLEATAYNTQGASFSQQITVTVVPPQVGGLSNGASFAQSVAPGSIVSLFISGFPLPTATASTIPLPTNLGGASVTIGSGSLPFYYVSSTQINVQLPWDLPTGANTVMVSGGGASATAAFNVVPAAPGIFVWGSNQAVVQNQDLTLNQPAKPAKAGSWVTVYLTGIGPLDNPVGLGDATPAQPLSRATTAAQATVGGMAAQIYFIGMTPGLVGLAQANIQVPSTLAPGTYPIQIVMGTVASNAPLITTN